MDLPIDLIKIILDYLKTSKDILNLRLTNKSFYTIYKNIPIFRNNIKIYEIVLKENNITWYKSNSNIKVKEIIFKPYGGIEINNLVYTDDNIINNYDYSFNLPYNLIKVKKDKKYNIKHTHNIINNEYKTEIIPVNFQTCQLS